MKTLWRAGILIAAAVTLSGCSSLVASSYETIRLAIIGPDSVITTDYINSLQQPALSARLNQSEALLIQASRDGGLAEWHGLSQALVTHNGRLVQSAGLPNDADVIAPLTQSDPFQQDLRSLADNTEITRLVDFPALYLTGVPQHASYSKGPTEQLEIMGVSRELLRLDELIEMPALSFKATNHYWVDPASGKVLASTQYVAPGLAALHLVELNQTAVRP